MKKAIVIGSSTGIGCELAKLLGGSGYAVGLAGRRMELMHRLRAEIPTPTYLRAIDLSQPAEARQALAALIAEMDGVDLIVINAGVGHPDPDWEEQLRLLRVNVIGFAAAAELAVDYFIGRGSGHLVGVSSVQAVRGLTTAYSASKAFASTYLEAQRLRAAWLGSNVCVTEVRPGFVQSAMTAGQAGLFWMVSAEEAARQIHVAIEDRKRIAYIPKRWRIVAGLLRLVPHRVLAWGGTRWSPPLRRPADTR